ncbi:hypothetical protein IG631_24213 [Alternaria alternata]|nr:hypothetical protein IG631_24213 [Alternaria alternata]
MPLGRVDRRTPTRECRKVDKACLWQLTVVSINTPGVHTNASMSVASGQVKIEPQQANRGSIATSL